MVRGGADVAIRARDENGRTVQDRIGTGPDKSTFDTRHEPNRNGRNS
jgi:hypothetical protein